ncbi:MAG: nucleotidyltransferase [Kineosporiaceae bacterium]|nr:nucleotidyltransferase [Kineosporiaceae bacterium]MBK8075412.1 nucleotidyltransferase [Kineosporiaceae bacterium]
MTTHAKQFNDAMGRINPGDDAAHAQQAHTEVSEALKADPKLKDLDISPILIGSYKRQVSIRRVKDVDVFARLKKATASTRPGDIMDHVAVVLEDTFPDRVERQHRSFKVDFPDFDLSVDVVIARPCVKHPEEHWQIPEKIEEDGNARWVETHPDRMTELTTEANKTYLLNADDAKSGAYVRVVKLVRQVRRTWGDDQPGGYYFEVLTWHAFQDLQPEESTLAGYLTVVLRHIADHLPDYESDGPVDPTLDGKTIKSKATPEQVRQAAKRMAEAADLAESALAEDDACRSALQWQELLGMTHNTDDPEHIFAMPEYCTADGRTKADASLTRGSVTVPAGQGRYA